ncbi:hypothetical protein [Arenibaculum sp.]|jgi:predicted nucleotidyltransferase|uniref:hypothetical protein n=1 Tax=Arenibaculum sp. TaxID=2865862 RepID=UPI002E132E2A|nr:hypothetical protein [Arenibaculum sp.]
MTSTLTDIHAAFLDRARRVLAADPRIHTLLAGGSFVHGGLDAFSDLDLIVLVEEEAYAEVMDGRTGIAARLGDLLSAFTGEHVGEPRLLICLYGSPLLHVDLKFVTSSDLDRRIERPAILWSRDEAAVAGRLARARIAWPDQDADWFEARAWVWLHYAASKLGRGELFEAIGMLAFFREQVLGPMLHRRAGRPQRGVRRIEALGRDGAGALAATMAGADAASVRKAILASVDLYLDLRADDPPAAAVRSMPGALRDFIGDEALADAPMTRGTT